MDKEKLDTQIVRLVLKLSKSDDTDEIAKLVRSIDTLIDVRDRLYPEEEEVVPVWKSVLSNPAFWGLLMNGTLGVMTIHSERTGIITSKLWPKIQFWR